MVVMALRGSVIKVLAVLALFSMLILCWTLQAAELPRVTGLSIDGDTISWDAQEGATGYNIHLDYRYYDTVRGSLSYTVSEPGKYHVISFNDNGDFGVTRSAEEGGQPYIFVEYGGEAESVKYDFHYSVLLVYHTCQNVSPGDSCIARCPNFYEHDYGTASIQYLSGGGCSTSDIVEADAFVGPTTYSCTVPTFSGEVVAQAICVVYR